MIIFISCIILTVFVPAEVDADCDETLRYSGTMLLLVITYTNIRTYDANKIEYELRF